MATCKDFSRSVVAASDELRDIYCEPCLDGGKQIEAEGFCVDCGEYLCGECYKIHTRFKAFKHHVLKDKGQMPLDPQKSRAQDVCVERCGNHPTKIVEYFCRSCDILGCSACITVSHRQCENVDHIPDIAKDPDTREEFNFFLIELESKYDYIDEYISKIQLKTNISDDITNQGKAELRRQRNEINKYFDQLEADIDKRMRYIDKSNRNSLQAASGTADSIKDILTKIKTSIRSKEGANCELFIAMKQSKQSFDKLNKQYEKLRQESRIQPFFLTPTKQKQNTIEIGRLRKANFVSKIDIGEDIGATRINGMATIQNHFLALLESNSRTVYVFDTRNTQVVDQINLQCRFAWEITNVNTDQLAVLITCPDCQIQLLSVDQSGKISKHMEIKLNKKYNCIRSFLFKSGKFFMIDQQYIIILDMGGNHVKTLPTRCAMNICTGIAISPDEKVIYLTKPTQNNVTSLTLDGKVNAIYTDTYMTSPKQMTVDNEGFIYVCCEENIYQLSGDLSYGHILIDDRGSTITYCNNKHRLYLGYVIDVNVYKIDS
jgi:regulator of sigma D